MSAILVWNSSDLRSRAVQWLHGNSARRLWQRREMRHRYCSWVLCPDEAELCLPCKLTSRWNQIFTKPGTSRLADLLSHISQDARACAGSKVLCQCCGPNYPDQNECKPTQTDSKCYGTVLVCRNIFKNASPPFVDTVCSTYACGVCLGIGLGAEDLLSRKDNGTIKLFTKYGQDIDDFDSQIAPTDVTKFSIDLKEGNVL